LLSPLFLVIGIAIMVDSKGSPIYIQRRIGQNGVHFTFPKFRSMKQGSDEKRMEILGSPDVGMVERYRNDPRITRIGRILRRFSLDELPQLWCVLIGTMSLVGPRPILPEEEPHLESSHFKRNIAKPGLTGIWQVSGRKETSWQDRMFFDLEYIRDWSVGLDVILIARTFKAIFTGKGSY
jgi:lipopolysaccharide/colanic/teichoic acid biosynthesis glycosyltransferase